jgi:hypothetical protein
MVQIIPAGTAKKPTFAQRLNVGFGQGLEVGQKMMQTYQQEQAASKLGLDPEVMRGLDPQTRNQILGEALQQNIKVQRAGKTAGMDLSSPAGKEGMQQRQPGRGQEFLEENQPSQRQQAPEFLQSAGKPRQGGSNFPQQVTGGEKKPIVGGRDKLLQDAKNIQQQALEAGQPVTQLEALQTAQYLNDLDRSFNADVEAEQDKRRLAQETYGAHAEQALQKVYPEASDEVRALFQKKGEEAAGQFKSEAEIKGHVAQEAKNFSKTIAQLRNDIGPPRATSTQKMLGTGRDAEATKISFRNKLKPLTDLGLYDTARNELSKLGYHPEERETIIADLGEGTKKTLVEMPQINREKTKASRGSGNFSKGYYSPASDNIQPLNSAQKAIFTNNLSKVFETDPSTNIVLLRKQYEDKGVDWRDFSEALNDMIYNGQVKLNPDQFGMLHYIDQPPLNELDKILHGAKLIGR